MQRDWRPRIYAASRLDEFRAYMSGEMFDGSEYTSAEFVTRMTTYEETPQMAAGKAVHKLIEHAAFGALPEHAECKGWKVHFDLNAEIAMPAAREVYLEREHKGIPLFGRVDAINASTVHDTKTTANVDVDRYLDSYQWRSYLWMSGRRMFVYDILKVKVEEDTKLVIVQDYIPIKLSAYPGMDKDVEDLLESFDACVKTLAIPEIMLKKMALAA